MSTDTSESALIAEYEWLRQLAKMLDGQSNYVDLRLVEIERLLPDVYRFADDEVARERLEGGAAAAEVSVRRAVSLSPCKTEREDGSPVFVKRKSGQSPGNDEPDERYVPDERR